MQRKVFLLLLILPLLCGAGEAEASAEDPRALWRAAMEELDRQDCIDIDTETEVKTVVNDKEVITVRAQRVRGSGLQGASPVYQAVITGDYAGEIYYANGTVYSSLAFGNWQAPMQSEDFREYLKAGTVKFREDGFKTVEMKKTETGYELSFSEPAEKLLGQVAGAMTESYETVKERSLSISGTVYLSENGRYLRSVTELTYTLILYGSSEVSVSSRMEEKLIADSDVEVLLPNKLSSYQEVNDIYAPTLLYNALHTVRAAGSLESRSEISFDGMMGYRHGPIQRETSHVMECNPAEGTYRFYYDNGNFTPGYALDLSHDKCWYKNTLGLTELELSAEEIQEVMTPILYEYATPEQMNLFENIHIEHTENGYEISFTPARSMQTELILEVLVCFLDNREQARYHDGMDRWQYNGASGLIVLDEEGKLKSIVYTVDFLACTGKGWVRSEIKGTATYQRHFENINEPVEFPERYVSWLEREE